VTIFKHRHHATPKNILGGATLNKQPFVVHAMEYLTGGPGKNNANPGIEARLTLGVALAKNFLNMGRFHQCETKIKAIFAAAMFYRDPGMACICC